MTNIESPAQLALALEEGKKFITECGVVLFYDKTKCNPFQYRSASGDTDEMRGLWALFDKLVEIPKVNIFEYAFDEALVIGANSGRLYKWYKYRDTLTVRLLTINETPPNTKMLWHPSLGRPKDLNLNANVLLWYQDDTIERVIARESWSGVKAFMIIE